MTNSTSPLKYEVNLHTHSVDKVGERTNNNQIFTFENEDILEARRAAIAKAKELEDEFTNDTKFVPSYVAAVRGYLDYSAYSLIITLHYPFVNGTETVDIFGGEEEEQLEWLEHEATIIEDYADIELTVIYDDGESYEIIEEDSEFLLD